MSLIRIIYDDKRWRSLTGTLVDVERSKGNSRKRTQTTDKNSLREIETRFRSQSTTKPITSKHVPEIVFES